MSSKGRGRRCSINGKKYEVKVFNIVKNCKLNNKPLNDKPLVYDNNL